MIEADRNTKNKKFLMHKGLINGDEVCFRVENQNCWIGPLEGTLDLESEYSPCIIGRHNGYDFLITIGKGYDAYVGTVTKKCKDSWLYKSLREHHGRSK